MENQKEVLQGINAHLQNIRKQDPEFMGAFMNLSKLGKKPGVLSGKIKQLIGIAVSVKAQCDRCIPWHVKNALDEGATRQEVLEACEVAVTLGGGPALMYVQNVMKALDDLGAA
ncbi:MAG: carboxymuconolactone decarboxylase family protein [Promethearchaeota archaeon]